MRFISGMKKLTILLAILCLANGLWVPAEAASAPAESVPEIPEGAEKSSEEGADDSAHVYEGPVLNIENENMFSGMDRPYMQGYMPQVEGGAAHVVLPLVPADGADAPAAVQVSVNLGDPEASPFVFQNYDMTVPLRACQPDSTEGTEAEKEMYLVDLTLSMREGYASGRYPVSFVCSGTTPSGRSFDQTFIVFVTTEAEPEPEPSAEPESGGDTGDVGGSSGGAEPAVPSASAEPTPILQPKLLVTSYSADPSPISAGSSFSLHIVVRNTSARNPAINLLLGVDGADTDIYPAQENTFYYNNVVPDGSIQADLVMTVPPEASAGPKKINVHAGYDGPEGTAYTEDQTITVEVVQPVRFEFDEAEIPAQIRAGETLSLPINVMNMGRTTIMNVCAQIEAPGFSSQTTLYLGNVESGTAKKGNMTVFVGAKEGDERYGNTAGTLTVSCEDEAGNPYVQVQEFTSQIEPPDLSMPEEEVEEEEEPNNQWQISVIVAGCIAAAAITLFVLHRRKQAREEEEDEDL